MRRWTAWNAGQHDIKMEKISPMQVYFSLFLSISIFFAQQAFAQINPIKVVGTSENAVIFLNGEVDEMMANDFYRATDNLNHATVILQSPGGHVAYGLNIAARIAIKGYATAVIDSSCASMCSIIWLAGERRYMTRSSEILVHAAYKVSTQDGSEKATVSGSANAEIGAFLGMLGLSREAIRYVTSADPHEAMNPITPAVANVLGIEFILASSESLVSRPATSELNAQFQLSADLLGLANNCDGIFDINAQHLQDTMRLVLDHAIEKFGTSRIDSEIEAFSQIAQAERSRTNRIRWCLLAESRIRSDGFDSTVIGPSYACKSANLPAEHAICNSRELWAYDQAMANLYFSYKRNSTGEGARRFLQSQRDWIASRNLCQRDEVCLLDAYSMRILEFGY